MIASITFYSVVLFVHIAAVVIAFGVTFTYPLVGPWTAKNHPRSLGYLHHMQDLIGQRVIMPFASLALLAGIYLVAKSKLYEFSDWWVSFGFVSLIVLLGLGGAFFAPKERRLAELADADAATAGDGEYVPSQEYLGLIKQVGMVGALSSLLVLATVFVMVMGSRFLI